MKLIKTVCYLFLLTFSIQINAQIINYTFYQNEINDWNEQPCLAAEITPLETCKWPVGAPLQLTGLKSPCFDDNDCFILPMTYNDLVIAAAASGHHDAYVDLYSSKMAMQSVFLSVLAVNGGSWETCYGSMLRLQEPLLMEMENVFVSVLLQKLLIFQIIH